MSDLEVLDRILRSRRSCRGYLDRQVPREIIDQLLTTAQRAASWCNTQPWELVITSGDETTQLAEAMLTQPAGGPDLDFPPGYSGIHDQRRKEVGWQLYDAVGVQRGDREASGRQMLRNFEFFGAPHAAIVTTERDLGVYGAIDCGLYLDAFLLTAEALGLATCAQAAIAMHAPLLRARYDLPDSRQVVCAIAFGYADPDHPSAGFMSGRAPIEDAVTYVG